MMSRNSVNTSGDQPQLRKTKSRLIVVCDDAEKNSEMNVGSDAGSTSDTSADTTWKCEKIILSTTRRMFFVASGLPAARMARRARKAPKHTKHIVTRSSTSQFCQLGGHEVHDGPECPKPGAHVLHRGPMYPLLHTPPASQPESGTHV